MKKIGLCLSLCTLSFGTWAACSYDFDATQAQITAAMPGLSKFPSIIGQTSSFTVVNSSSLVTYVAANAKAITGQNKGLPVAQNGIIAYEYKFKAPVTLLPNNEQMMMYPVYAEAYHSGGKADIGIVYANHVLGSTTPDKVAIGAGVVNNYIDLGQIELPVAATADGFQKIGIYINQNSNQLGIIFNGVNKGYIAHLPGKISSLAFTNGYAYTGFETGSSYIGKTFSIELITDKNKLQFAYPTGTKDLCGNTL